MRNGVAVLMSEEIPMNFRYALGAALLAVCLLPAAAEAARPTPTFRPLGVSVRPATPARSIATCNLGVTGPAVFTVSYVIPPDDQYYTLLDPAEQGCEAQGGVQIHAAHIGVEFQYAYETPIRVGIVQADLSNPECPVPVPGAYLCPPTDYMLAGPGTGAYDVTLPLATSCTLTGPAFLEITFTEWGDWWEVPGLLLTGQCAPCNSYNYYPGDHYDLCTFGFEGNPIMYVDAVADAALPVARGTWGRIKTMHR